MKKKKEELDIIIDLDKIKPLKVSLRKMREKKINFKLSDLYD